MNAVLGQWDTIMTLSSGLPVVLAVPQNTSFSFGGSQRPDATHVNANLGSKRTLERWFDTSQFSQAKDYTFGTLSRTHSSIRSDGYEQIDFSLFKMFRIRERARLEVRGESFNLLNHPVFASPGATVSTPLFGVVSAQENSPRQVQLGIKIIF